MITFARALPDMPATFRNSDPATKYLGDIAYETILDKDPGKDKVHEKPETNHKVKYDKNNAMKTQMYEKPEPKDGMLKNNPKESKMFEEPEMRMLKTTLKGTYDKNVNVDRVMDKKPEMNVNVEYEASIQVHQAGEINVFEEAKTGTLKTNLKYKNVNVDIIDDIMFNTEYKAGIQVYQGEEVNMFEGAETRMLKTKPKGKNNVAT
jgi:hypothetical protein